jgi:propionyl-CoA synthetase
LIFEGKPVGTPHAGVFWDVIREHNVNTFFCAPTAFRAIRGEDPTGKELIKNGGTHALFWLLSDRSELSSLRAVFLAGERSDAETLSWARHLLGKPVVDNYWQTETGWPMVSNMLHPSFVHIPKDGSATKPVPGFDVKVLASDGQEAPPLSLGSICVAKPLPPGWCVCFFCFWV